MTGRAPAISRRFPTTTLPWIVAAAAVVVYSLTLNPWINLGNLQQVARISGWTWQPSLSNPLYSLVTAPLQLLPEAWVPAALNLLNALLAAATLGLLARCVAILPHNRTHEQRLRVGLEGEPLAFKSAWLPPVFAALICGIQLTFWENATSGTPEMLNLLLFAYVVRCLLEYRLSQKQGWLYQTAFFGGLGMANDFSFVGFLPIYLVVLVWLRGVRFFEPKFLLRMFVAGLIGISLYLLTPIMLRLNPDVSVTFWQGLKHVLVTQKNVLLGFPKKTLLALSLTSLLPILLISIRWPQSFGDINPQGAKVAQFFVHIVHAALAMACIWVAFDPPASPRNAGLGLSFLTFYFLAALAIGYFVGYFLLIFGRPATNQAYTFGRNQPSATRHFIVGIVWIVCAIATVGIVLRNLPTIQTTNSTILRDYASLMADAIPDGDTVVLSDDSVREYLLRGALAQQPNSSDVLVLNTAQLKFPQYHLRMSALYPDRWVVKVPTNLPAQIPDRYLVELMLRFSRSNTLCYAHPSFGYYFEFFDPQPAGILDILTPYQAEDLYPKQLDDPTIESNEAFWNETALRLLTGVRTALQAEQIKMPKTTRQTVLDWFKLKDDKNRVANLLGDWLSRTLDTYGVKLQRAGKLELAGNRFAEALELNPDNLAAQVNGQFNKDLLAGNPSKVKISKTIEEEVKRYKSWQNFIASNGIFDEPRFTMALADVFLNGRLFRQALGEFKRVAELDPDNFPSRLWCARLVTLIGHPDLAMEMIHELQSERARFNLDIIASSELDFSEAATFLAKQDQEQAERIIKTTVQEASFNTNVVATALQICMNSKLFSTALDLVNQQLTTTPDDPALLASKGFVLMRMENYEDAIRVLTQALDLKADNRGARLNRAIANLQAGNLDASAEDYELLLLDFPNAYPIYFGLGQIAYQRQDTNQAIYNFQLYLSNAPPNTMEAQTVRQRLQELSNPAP